MKRMTRPFLVYGIAVFTAACAPTDLDRDAGQYRGRIGEFFEFDCPRGGVLGVVWGTAIYTDDSDVCSAAVHAGAISHAAGGGVSIEILEGQASYCGSRRNGVTSSNWGSFSGSFRVVAGDAMACDPPPITSCSPACSGGDVCVMWGTMGSQCGGRCASAGECASGCCASLTDGSRACAPSSSFCPAGCPAGQFPLYEGGPCAPPVPATCPNDWVVCACPETHGVWCHAACAFSFFCDGSPCSP